jgi:hypothetical protein
LADLPNVAAATVAGSGEEEQHATEVDFVVNMRNDPIASTAASPALSAPQISGLPTSSRSGTVSTSGANGSGSTRSHAALLATAPTVRTVVYVLDRSLSMGPSGALWRAQQELLASLAQLPAGAHFQVILYNRQAEPLFIDGHAGFLPADQRTRDAVARELDRFPAAGNTDHVHALRKALLLRPDVLFLVTDANDLTDKEVLEITRLNISRTAIHTVQLTRNRAGADDPLRRLANYNGGTFRCVDPVR